MAKNTPVAQEAPKSTALATATGGALAAMFEQEDGSGFENTDEQSFAIPFLTILQSGSPQCKKSDGAYIKGAEEGMLFNTVTNELYDGDAGVTVIPCYYRRSFVEWAPREGAGGGGFRGEHAPSDPIVATVSRGERGDVLPNGNYLVDTRVHYVLIVKEDGSFSPAVISMSSTQVKKSRQWMSKMDGLKFKNSVGALYTPPMFSHSYHVTTTPEQNDQGSWFGWRIGAATLIEDATLFAAAKEFKRAVSAGEIKAQQPGGAPSSDDIPY